MKVDPSLLFQFVQRCPPSRLAMNEAGRKLFDAGRKYLPRERFHPAFKQKRARDSPPHVNENLRCIVNAEGTPRGVVAPRVETIEAAPLVNGRNSSPPPRWHYWFFCQYLPLDLYFAFVVRFPLTGEGRILLSVSLFLFFFSRMDRERELIWMVGRMIRSNFLVSRIKNRIEIVPAYYFIMQDTFIQILNAPFQNQETLDWKLKLPFRRGQNSPTYIQLLLLIPKIDRSIFFASEEAKRGHPSPSFSKYLKLCVISQCTTSIQARIHQKLSKRVSKRKN